MTDERVCLESPVIPIIVIVTLLVECQLKDGAVYILPFTGEDMVVTELRAPRRRKNIHGNSPMNRRIGVRCCEQIASPYLPFGERADKRSSEMGVWRRPEAGS